MIPGEEDWAVPGSSTDDESTQTGSNLPFSDDNAFKVTGDGFSKL